MDQTRLDDLEKRVNNVENENGWHESAKYVLEKLDTLTDAVKENRVDNASAHKALYDKMDAQKTMCANRPMECQKMFLQNRTFYWLIIVLIVLFGTSFSLSGTALRQNVDHEIDFTEHKTIHEAECVKVKEKFNKYLENTIQEHTDTE